MESDSDDEVLGPIVPFSRKPPAEEEVYDSDRDPDWAPFAIVSVITRMLVPKCLDDITEMISPFHVKKCQVQFV